jgi:alpha-beta hydrolase superfamily lysophospholipase
MSELEERESVVLVSQGQKIFGILHLPRKKERSACVLICHGLAGHKTGRYRVYVDLAEKLLEAGIASFRFDFRGCGDSEGDFEEMTIKGEVADASIALSYLMQHPKIDPSRIGIFGRSLGAAVGVLTASASGGIASMALWGPFFDGEQWREQWKQLSSGQLTQAESEEWRRINGQVPGLLFYTEMFDMHIPENLSALERVPLLLIHGELDEVISISHSEKYLSEREKTDAETILIRIPGADHDFTNPTERADVVDQTVAFFKRTLS